MMKKALSAAGIALFVAFVVHQAKANTSGIFDEE